MQKRRNKKVIIGFAILAILLSSCGVSRQAKQASTLAKCDFRIAGVSKVNVAGIDLGEVKSISDLNIGDAAKILAGLTAPMMPLSLRLDIEVRNPNTTDAGLRRLDYIIYIDDVEMTSGTLDKPVSIPAGSTQVVPVDMAVDLKKVLTGESGATLMNFAMNLSGTGTKPTRFTIKLKPSIFVGNKALGYPGYITVKTEYTSK